MYTTPPGKHVVLYDGRCRFCVSQVRKLLALAKPGVVEALDFQDPEVLARFPGVTYHDCMQAVRLIRPDGRVITGFEAAVQAVATRRVLKPLAYLYYLPGLRQLCDGVYRRIAARRYDLMGKTDCVAGACALHDRPE